MFIIPKTSRRLPDEAKLYRPINLSSFLLKAMEKTVDNHMKNVFQNGAQLHSKQFVYQPSKSTIDALHYIVRKVEKTIGAKELVAGIFIDIKGAFDNTSFTSIRSTAEKHVIEPAVRRQIKSMLKARLHKRQSNFDSYQIVNCPVLDI